MTFFPRCFVLSAHRMMAVLAAASLFCSASVAKATLITNSVSSNVETTYDSNILNNDLIEAGSSALAGTPTTTGTIGDSVVPSSVDNWTGLTDGTFSNPSNTWITNANAAGTPAPSITYNFDTAANPLGYKLTSIRSIYGWNSSAFYSDQRYVVDIAMVGSPTTFTQLADVDYRPFGYNTNEDGSPAPNSSQFTLTDSTGTLATGVAAIRFAFLNNRGGYADQYDGQVIREIDVSGSPIPEPNTIIILLTGLLGLLAYAWRRRK